MGIKKGHTNNPKGRPPGKPNKVTQDLRQWVKNFISGKTDEIERDWKLLEPKDRIVLFEKLLKYSLPTLQSTELKTDFNQMTDEQLDFVIESLKNQRK